MQLARDAQTSGDPVAAENYYQHAEHYFRVIAAAQEQFRQNNPHLSRPENESPRARATMPTRMATTTGSRRWAAQANQTFGTREPQPYIPRDAQPFPQHQQHQPHQPHHQPRSATGQCARRRRRRPAAVLHHRRAAAAAPAHQQNPQGQNGHDNQPDRFPLHRRRRRHRGPRHEGTGGGDRRTTNRAPRRRVTAFACCRYASPGDGASAGSSAGTSRARSRRAGIAR